MSGIMANTQVFSSESVTASGTATSSAVPIENANALALHVTTLSGTSPDVTFTYSLSMDDSTYVTPVSPVTIGANLSAADVLDFSPEASKYIKITVTNNNSVNAATVTANLAVQEL